MVTTDQQARDTASPSLTEEEFTAFLVDRLEISYRTARLLLRNEHDAQDATQDALVAAWRARGSLRNPERVAAWFSRTLLNVCRERLRRHARRRTVPLDGDHIHSRLDAFGAVGERDAIERAFVALNADQRIVVVLRYYQDLTIEDIARLIEVPPGTVKSRLHHSLAKLRSMLEREQSGGGK